ncbi:hypothetical protein ACFVJI_09510 [Streptomyces sp. NPDC127584]|uniref:hypothetical protein n=1 Tax=Streptomyces sp. NPDC127584 TaxID=3345403 RepID=UPI003625F9A5
MNRIRTTVALGLVLSASLVSGCSGGTEPGAKADGKETAKATASAPKRPVYKGKPVAGLAHSTPGA